MSPLMLCVDSCLPSLRSSWLNLLVDQILTRDQTRMLMTTSAAICIDDGAAAESPVELDIIWQGHASGTRIQSVNTHSHLEGLPCTQDWPGHILDYIATFLWASWVIVSRTDCVVLVQCWNKLLCHVYIWFFSQDSVFVHQCCRSLLVVHYVVT